MNLYAFTEKYNKISDQYISIKDFYFSNPATSSYTAILGDEGNNVLLTLNSGETDIIETVTVSLIKEKNKIPTAQQLELYNKILKDSLLTYCDYNDTTANNIISAFSLNDQKSFIQNGELTLKKDNFYLVYYSTEMISQVMIYNTFLNNIAPTEKPVSKPYYAEDFIIKEAP
jgi:hypothetical protein